ncbi:MAG: EscU/YscU/HrcU family type III secretion system export apparatus switch protein [Planctomycetaceae bacterium]
MSAGVDRDARTEQPTLRRRQEVRARGQAARSLDLTAAVWLLAMVGGLYFLGGDIASGLARLLKAGVANPDRAVVDVGSATGAIRALIGSSAQSLAPLALVALAAAVIVNVVQVGLLATTEPLRPSLARLDPRAVLRRWFSWDGTAQLVGSLLKLAVVVGIAASFISSRLPALAAASQLDAGGLCRQIGRWGLGLGFQLALGLLALAVLDYGFQLWRFEQGLRMTRQEVLDELRNTEGDPQVRKRRREAHRRLAGAARPPQDSGA